MNILIKKIIESEVTTDIGVCGKWLLEIVHPNGAVERPFGDEMRKNVILDSGFDFILYPDVYADRRSSSVAFTNTAIAGSSNIPPDVLQTGIQTAISGQTTSSTVNCYMIDNKIDESRTYVKTFNFPSATVAFNVNEFVIQAVSTQGFSKSLSRFVTPSTISVSIGSMIRLTYSLKIKIPGITNQIPIVTGILPGFNMLGHLKLVGAWSSIFGDMNSSGVKINDSQINGDSFAVDFLPFYQNTLSSTGSNGYLISSGINFPNVNSYLPDYTIVGSFIEQASPNSNGFVQVFNRNASLGQQSANYVFSSVNPSSNSTVGGILFKGVRKDYTPKPKCGWYWKFLNPQIKGAGKMLSINLTQKLNRL